MIEHGNTSLDRSLGEAKSDGAESDWAGHLAICDDDDELAEEEMSNFHKNEIGTAKVFFTTP